MTPLISLVRVSLIIWMAMGIGSAAPALSAQDATQDRITDMANKEVLRSIQVALVAVRSTHATNAQYLAAIQPYAPLDLQVLRVNVPVNITRMIRDFYLAAVGKETNVDVAARQAAFKSCTESCAKARRDSMVASLDIAQSLVKKIHGLKHVTTIAAWADGWSVDSLMHRADGYTVRMHSPVLALVPWREGPVQSDAATTFLKTIGTSLPQINSAVATMRSHNIAAVTHDITGNTRVVMASGLGPASAGLLFRAQRDSVPKIGDVSRIGDIYDVVASVAPGVYYYETH
jgi:hypothetical protein